MYGNFVERHSFRIVSGDYAETVPFHKMSTPRNQVKLRNFTQCKNQKIWRRKFHEIIAELSLTLKQINKTNEHYLNPTLIPKVTYMPDHKYIYLLMHLITGMLMITTVLSKNSIGLQKIHISKSLQSIPLALSSPLNFNHPKIRISNLDKHKIIDSCAIFDL